MNTIQDHECDLISVIGVQMYTCRDKRKPHWRGVGCKRKKKEEKGVREGYSLGADTGSPKI